MKIIPANTRIDHISTKFNGQPFELFFKREDLNPSGSFKDRLVYDIWSKLHEISKQQQIVLSSSGNLAISVLFYAQAMQQKLENGIKIFIPATLPEIKRLKLEKLAEHSGLADVLVTSARPKSDCARYARDNGAFWLRNSAGPDYPNSYHSLAQEINNFHEQEKLDAVITCVSSGTAASGICQKLAADLPLFAIQTSKISPLAKQFGDTTAPESTSLANAISDRIMSRKSSLKALIEERKGSSIACSNLEIEAALTELRRLLPGEQFTGNAALPLAGFGKLLKKGYSLNKVLIIISGN